MSSCDCRLRKRRRALSRGGANFPKGDAPGDSSRDNDVHPSSARRAAVKNWLGGDFIWRRLLCLQIGAPFIEASDNREDDSGSKHQPGEKGKVLIRTDLFSATRVQDPFVDEADEKFA